MKKILALIAIVMSVLISCSVAFSQTVDLLSEGNKHFETRNYQAAAEVYQRIVKTELDVSTKAMAWFNLGLTYQKLNQHDDAIKAFTEVFNMNVSDLEPGGHIMEPYRNYRSRSQWAVGDSLFAKGDYKGALEAYQTTRLKYPLESWCNVGRELAQYRYAIYEGLMHEYLGQYPEAVSSYIRVFAPRLVDLYEAAGQLEDLKRIMSIQDEIYLNKAVKEAHRPISNEILMRFRPSRRLDGILAIHASAAARDWPVLIGLLRSWSSGGGDGRQDVIIKMLAKHSNETVPLLKQELAKADIPPGLFYKALGMAGTPDAVATLKSIAEKEDGSWRALSLVHALSLAGKPGEQALAELDKIAKHNLRIAIDQYKSGELQERYNNELKFPRIPAKLILPKEL